MCLQKGKLWFTILICDDVSALYREGKWWFSCATECVEFLNLYIWGHKAIISFYQLKSLFFPQHAECRGFSKKKKKRVFSLSACIYAKHWLFIMSCYLLLVKNFNSWFVYVRKNCDLLLQQECGVEVLNLYCSWAIWKPL